MGVTHNVTANQSRLFTFEKSGYKQSENGCNDSGISKECSCRSTFSTFIFVKPVETNGLSLILILKLRLLPNFLPPLYSLPLFLLSGVNGSHLLGYLDFITMDF